MIREYDEDAAETVWICLDTRAEPGDRAEGAVETAASLAGRALREGRSFGFATAGAQVEPGTGSGQLERVLHALARVDFTVEGPRLDPPTDPKRCVLVSLSGVGRSSYGAYVTPGTWSDGSPGAAALDSGRERRAG